ncbi:MAG TPA: TolC family protein [Methylotenera sp.]|nr:TolC family protein [Methylotenera sp.]HPM50307.1 TolC family protein [Methylotenera sp.]
MKLGLKRAHYLLMFAGISLNAPIAFAENGNATAAETQKSTTLSSASDAAAAAATAASAAALAAESAANAANAAVEAINAVLPPSQRKSITKKSIASPAQSEAKSTDTSVVITPVKPYTEDLNLLPDVGEVKLANGLETKFGVPSERSLVGLVGTYEIAVSSDMRGAYARGVAGIQEEHVDQVSPIGQLNMAEAVKASLGFSRDVLVASARVGQAKAQTGQAKAFLLPSLLLQAKGGREISSPGVQIDGVTGKPESRNSHGRSDTSLTLKQPLLDLPGYYDYKRRQVVEQSRQEGQRSSEGETYLSTINAYLALASSRISADMTADYEAQIQELFRYVEKRAGAGAASNSDKERVRARSLSAHSSRIEQEAAHAAAGVDFVRQVNLAPSNIRLPDLEEVGLSIVPNSLDKAMELALEANPEIAQLKAEMLAAELDKTAAKSRYLPRVDLELSDTNSVHAGGSNDSQRDQRLMVVMNWSLFNGGGDLKYNEEKAARYEELKYRVDDQRRRVLQSLSAQYATLEATRLRIDEGYRELASITSAAQAMSKRMLSGNQSLLDMLDVYDRFYQARLRLVNLHTQEIAAVAQIARLLQGPPKTSDAAIGAASPAELGVN